MVEVGLLLMPLPVSSLNEGEGIIEPGDLEASLMVSHGSFHVFLHNRSPDICSELLRDVGSAYEFCLDPLVGYCGVCLLLGV